MNSIYYKFPPGSKLRDFLSERGKTVGGWSRGVLGDWTRGTMNMDRLIYTLKMIMIDEDMITDRDPGLIMCTPELERVLGTKALHERQLYGFCRKLVTPLSYESQIMMRARYEGVPPNIAEDAGESAMEILDHVYLDPRREFYLDPRLGDLFDTLPNITFRSRDTFTYEMVMRVFRVYCLHNGLVPITNDQVAILKGDPMGVVVKRDVIHQDQICFLLTPFVACINLWEEEPTQDREEEPTQANGEEPTQDREEEPAQADGEEPIQDYGEEPDGPHF